MSRPFIPGGPERFAHQKRGLRDLLRRRGVGALIFDPGTGKTATTIDYMGVLALGLGVEEVRVLVVSPLAAVDTWVDQMGKWASPELNYWVEAIGGSILQRAETLADRGGEPFARPLGPGSQKRGTGARSLHVAKSWAWASRPEVERGEGPDAVPGPRLVVEVLNIDALASRRRVGSRTTADIMVDAIKRYSPHLVVVDELHKIKSVSGNASRLLARVTPHVPRRVGLTGTVMPHGALDVFAQWRFIDPHAFGEVLPNGARKVATFGQFRERYAKMGGYLGREVIGYQNLDELQDIMAERATVVRKEDALDLPATTDATVHVELSPKESKAYAEMKKALAADLGADGGMVTVGSRLTQMMRLRQITSGHLPDEQGVVHEVGDSKVQTIRSLVHDTLAGESRLVIFCQFTHEILALKKSLAAKGTEVMVIAGGTPNEERMRMRKRFGSEDPSRMVLVAQITTMSLAVNELVTASNAIFGSMTLQRDEYIQGRDRLNRIGQTRPVTFWHVMAPGTVDEVILSSHQQRTDLESAVLRHILEQSGE